MGVSKEISDTLERMINHGVKPMGDKDYERALIVEQQLDDFSHLKVGDMSRSSIDTYADTLDDLYIYDDSSLVSRFYSIMDDVNKHAIDTVHSSSKILDFSSCVKTNNLGNLYVHSLNIPKELDDLSHVYLSHEAHHILKDTNEKEYSDMLIYADVIPMFFELVLASNNKDKESEIIHNRLNLLSLSKNDVLEHFSRNKSFLLTSMLDSKKCQYFNSFYYVVLLYDLYLVQPKKVLKFVKKVLSQEITTRDMLRILNLSQDNHDYEVEKGIEYLKSFN